MPQPIPLGLCSMLGDGCGSKLNRDAGFGPCFHLPEFHFGTGFLSHSQMAISRRFCTPLVSQRTKQLSSAHSLCKSLIKTKVLDHLHRADLLGSLSAQVTRPCLCQRRDIARQVGDPFLRNLRLLALALPKGLRRQREKRPKCGLGTLFWCLEPTPDLVPSTKNIPTCATVKKLGMCSWTRVN